MMIKNKINQIINKLADSRSDTPTHLRELIFYFTTLMFLVFGFFVLMPSLVAAFVEKQYAIIVIDCLIYLVLIGFVVLKQIPFHMRAVGATSLFYILGTALLIFIGPVSAGFIWLFSFPVFTGIFINLRYVRFTLLINIVTLIVIGLFFHAGYIQWSLVTDYTTGRWVATALNFILLNYASAFSLGLLIERLEAAFQKEKRIQKELATERERLETLNQELNQEAKERIEAQKALALSEKRYRSVFDNTSTGILIIESNGIITTGNARMEALTGFKREDIEGRYKWTEFVVREDLEKMKTEFFPKLSTDPDSVADYEIRIFASDNTIKTVTLCMGFIPETRQSVVSLSDISPRKQAEKALRLSEQKYKRLIETIPDGIVILNRGNVVFANRRMAEIAERPIDSLTGLSIRSVLNQEVTPEKINHFIEAIENHDTVAPLILQVAMAYSGFIDTEITGTLSYFDNKECVMLIIRDITERNRAQQEKIYREKLQGVIEMAGAVCHELNQPMMAALGYGDILTADQNISDDTALKIEKIKAQIDRMGKITAKLMNITGYHTREYISGRKIVDIEKSSGTESGNIGTHLFTRGATDHDIL